MVAAESPALLYSKLLFTILVALYFLWCAWDPYQWHLLDGVNLVIHEAGHLFFRPFGEYLMIAGGSLLQVIMPALFVFYFFWNKKVYSAALVMLWVGESILNVSVYAGDSLKLQLPLLGGQDSVHDWNYLLTRAGLLASTSKIERLIRLCGTLVILIGLYFAFKSVLTKNASKEALDPTE